VALLDRQLAEAQPHAPQPHDSELHVHLLSSTGSTHGNAAPGSDAADATVTTVTESPQAQPSGPLLEAADQRRLVAGRTQVGDRLVRRVGRRRHPAYVLAVTVSNANDCYY